MSGHRGACRDRWALSGSPGRERVTGPRACHWAASVSLGRERVTGPRACHWAASMSLGRERVAGPPGCGCRRLRVARGAWI